MKKTINLLCLFCLLVLLNACKKDKDLLPEDQLIDPATTENFSHKRTCGHEAHMDKLLADPNYVKLHEAKFAKLETVAGSRSSNCSNPTLLAVAVHFQGISNPDVACLRQLAETQIDILNADYQGTNDDISNWDDNASQYFPGIENGDACLRFCLASQNHPSGYGLGDGDLAVTVNQTTGDNIPNWSNYINIIVRPNLGFLGYSPLGGLGNGDGVVVDAGAFGSGAGCTGVVPEAPYNLGRTLTHELGHYLLLDHIWGGSGGCNDDDDVDDTPVSSQEYYGCPSLGASSCSSTDMHMSYMDYTNDACMYMFSAGQIARVENYVTTSLQHVVDNAASTCGEVDPPTPTCDDGIQNGDETGIDCGGSCAPCESTPSCDDGVQNGQETGIDCGGPDCAPCEEGCVIPSSTNAVIIDANTVELSWSPVPSANKYRVRHRPEGGAWTFQNTTSTSLLLENLQANTTYQYQVKSLCGTERSRWTSLETFTTTDGGNGACVDFEFALTLDDYGSETTWELVDENGTVMASGGPYGNKKEGDVITDDWCLDEGCYTFTIYDDWGDGICCDYGQGSYQVTDANGDIIFESDGQFGFAESTDFCVGDLLARDIKKTRDEKSTYLKRKPRKRTK